MTRSTPKGTKYRAAALSLLALLSAAPCYAGVVFETNFDANADWNTNRQYQGMECTGTCTTAPANWSNHREVDGSGSWSNPTGSIQRLPGSQPDHTGTGAGKAYIVYNESHPVDNWPGDSELLKKLGASYNELYLRSWIRTQAGWQSVGGAASKILRLQYFNGTPGEEFANFSTGSNAPISLLLMGQMGASASYPNAGAFSVAYRCYPQTSDYYCNTGPSFQQNDTATYMNSSHPSPTASWADGNWHRYDMHVKMNTAGSNNGTFELAIDGVTVVSQVGTVQWISPGSSVVGWNVLSIGGNSNNSFSSQGAQWYAIDDVVVSTAPIPATYLPGGGAVTTVPAPANLKGSGTP